MYVCMYVCMYGERERERERERDWIQVIPCVTLNNVTSLNNLLLN